MHVSIFKKILESLLKQIGVIFQKGGGNRFSTTMISIENIVASPGEKVSGNAPILTSDGNEMIENSNIPITIINGIEDGPTVLVLSGIHGSEYIPIMASQKLANDLDPSNLRGAVILVHIANLPAYLGRTIYSSPVDGKNLNRVFPGKANGSLTEKIANFLVERVYPVADYALDIHSGDGNEKLGPSYSAYYGKAGSPEVIQKSKDMAFAFGFDLVVEFQWELLGTNISKAIWAGSAAVVRGIPSIDVEMAPGMGSSDSDSIDEACEGVLRVLDHLGISIQAEEDNVVQDEPCLVKERYFIDAPMDGSWVSLVDTETFITQGTSLGYMTDFFGRNRIFEAVAPSDGLVIIRFDSPPVLEGDTLAVIAGLNSSDSACTRLKRNMLPENSLKIVPMKSLLRWKMVAISGWFLAIGLGILIGMKRKKISKNDAQATISEMEKSDARIV